MTRKSRSRRDDPDRADDRLDHAIAAAYLFAADASAPVSFEQAAEPPGERYTFLREIGSSATGIIFEGRDEALDRPIVVKRLRPEHVNDEAAVRRFLEEAQIGGQLQHPGIVPVYGLGLDATGRPFFAMQRIAGETLATVLARRGDPAQERERCLEIFLRVCRAVAYAHASGVVHRDLNPHNVMVGSFGEVHVVDWGLARLMDRKEDGADGRAPASAAYLSPEQAAGESERVDERSDVFSLGAILCEILTGRPPYVGSRREQRAQSLAGRVGPARERLRTSGAEPELIELAVRCLAPERHERPRDAGAVSRTVSALLALAEQRAQQAEVEAAEERARAERGRENERLARHRAEAEKRARVRTLAIAAAIVATVLLVALELFFVDRAKRTRTERNHAALTAAMRRAEELEAAGLFADAAEWATRGVALAGSAEAGEDAWVRATALRERIRVREQAAHEAEERLRAEGALVTRLESLQTHARAHDPELPSRLHALYARAFRDFGIDMESLGVEEAAAKLRECRLVGELVAFLDDWSWVLRPAVGRECPAADPLLWDKLTEIALLADPDAWRDRFRRIARDGDDEELRAAAVAAETVDLPAVTMLVMARHLRRRDAPLYARAVLRRAYLRHPQDYWINRLLAETLPRHRRAEKVAHLRAALALRPDDPCTMTDLAAVFLEEGDPETAVALARRALRFAPAHVAHHDTLAAALWARGDRDGAIATYRQAIALDPGSGASHAGLATCLAAVGEHGKAAGHFRRAVELAPGDAGVLRDAAAFFANAADPAGRDPAFAVTLAQRAVDDDPSDPANHHVCGVAYFRAGRYEDALGMLEQAARLAWGAAGPRDWYWLAMAHQRLGHDAEAGDFYARAEGAVPEDAPELAGLRAEARAVLGLGEGG